MMKKWTYLLAAACVLVLSGCSKSDDGCNCSDNSSTTGCNCSDNSSTTGCNCTPNAVSTVIDGVDLCGKWYVDGSEDVDRMLWAIHPTYIQRKYISSDENITFNNGYIYGISEDAFEQFQMYPSFINTKSKMFFYFDDGFHVEVINNDTIMMRLKNSSTSATFHRIKGFK